MVTKVINTKQKDTWVSGSQEQRDIMACYEELKSTLPSSTSKEEWTEIEKAFQLALASHAGIRRKSGEPYIIHPLRVALIVANEIGLGPTSIVSAIIHDVVEDTSISINEVRNLFGVEVYKIVRGLTKIKKMFSWGKSMQVENFKKLLSSASEDNRIILVKLADRLDNMRYLDALPRQKQLKIAAETQQIYAPVAHRLGLNRIKAELEDLYLKYVHPQAYYTIAKRLSATRKERAEWLKNFSASIKKAIEKHDIKFRIEERAKSIYSIWGKINHNKIPFDKIYDLLAVRIIIDCDPEQEKALCWQTYGIIGDIYSLNPSRLRDWISKPKPNGYESLHTTVMCPLGEWAEVQMRTARMHEIAEKGVAAHWEYKRDIALGECAERLEKWLSEVRMLLEEGKSDNIHFMEDFKLSLYDDEVMVFDKSGKHTLLPKGATVLDFAIETLEKKGLQCSGAMIDKRFLPIDYTLKNAEQIDLILNEEQKISHHWMDILKTPKARRILKKFFRKQYMSTLEKGGEMVRSKLKEVGISLNKNVEMIITDLFNTKTVEKTYYKIGSKAISEKKLQMVADLLREVKEKDPGRIKSNPMKLQIEEDVVVTGANDSKYQLASCCLPIPDEEIFGVLMINNGIKIHRVDCFQAVEILSTQGPRITKAKWKREGKDTFLVFLEIKAANRKSMTKDIVNTIKKDVHIESLSFLKEGKYIKGNLTIEVEDAKKLSKVMSNLEGIQSIVSAERMSF